MIFRATGFLEQTRQALEQIYLYISSYLEENPGVSSTTGLPKNDDDLRTTVATTSPINMYMLLIGLLMKNCKF